MMVVVVGAVMWMVVRAVGIRTVGMIQLAMVSTIHLTTRTVFYGSIFPFFYNIFKFSKANIAS
jgi:hypothetical protein